MDDETLALEIFTCFMRLQFVVLDDLAEMDDETLSQVTLTCFMRLQLNSCC